MGKIRWTEKASNNLLSIHSYISKDSPTYAARFIKSLIKATSKLEVMSSCGRIVPEFESYGFREVLYQDYRIIYRIKESSKDVEILAVLHGARDFNRESPEEWFLD
jgi:addiction module RelE/StbE family toxin